jgi:hypothetical protein
MMFAAILSISSVAAVIVMFGILVSQRHLLRACYADGYRDGLKIARDVVRDRAHIAATLAREGELPYGMVRTQMAHQIEDALDELLLVGAP